MITFCIKFFIVYEDNDIILLNKPNNLIVHPGLGYKNDITMMDLLIKYDVSLKKIPRAGIVHRLDKGTTGLILIAKNILSYYKLLKIFKSKEIIREYEAIVIGKMISGGTINKPIARHPNNRIIMSVNLNGKQSITYYRIIQKFSKYTYIRLRLGSGRTHQIRVHMSSIKHPLLGDKVYGSRPVFPKKSSDFCKKIISNFDRPALHSTFMHFIHPTINKVMTWNLPIPSDMQCVLNELKNNQNMNNDC